MKRLLNTPHNYKCILKSCILNYAVINFNLVKIELDGKSFIEKYLVQNTNNSVSKSKLNLEKSVVLNFSEFNLYKNAVIRFLYENIVSKKCLYLKFCDDGKINRKGSKSIVDMIIKNLGTQVDGEYEVISEEERRFSENEFNFLNDGEFNILNDGESINDSNIINDEKRRSINDSNIINDEEQKSINDSKSMKESKSINDSKSIKNQ
ncbi:hypothetical protein NAPIS_ORF02011 [Vairimorpha apis BRL 01]|uniref:Uncharacterized protein n=1 Tax=Vairimorpha apis BRL 01 TaxID=1037528 RepID=T0KYI4_9MICR|nr:hypothetical protein NAPIS_ORF02011 [Vairimorpha apis BRL 01]